MPVIEPFRSRSSSEPLVLRFPRSRPRVAVVGLRGPISSDTRSLNFSVVSPALEKAFAMKRTEAVILVINSPGGSAVQSSLIGQHIRLLAQRHDKHTIAVVEDVAASGGYWLACAADEIVADAHSIIGSIGVVASGFGFQDLLKRWTIERRVYSAGDRKVQLDPFAAERKADVAHLNANLNTIHQGFIQWVQQRRGDRLAGKAEDLFSGQFWTGSHAIDLGLIDRIDHLPGLLQSRYGEKVRRRDVPLKRRRAFWGWRTQTRVQESGDLMAGIVGALRDEILWAPYR